MGGKKGFTIKFVLNLGFSFIEIVASVAGEKSSVIKPVKKYQETWVVKGGLGKGCQRRLISRQTGSLVRKAFSDGLIGKPKPT